MARFPTVKSCAGWKWVNPRVGRSLYCAAKAERRDMRTPSERMRYPRPVCKKMRSALLFWEVPWSIFVWEAKSGLRRTQ